MEGATRLNRVFLWHTLYPAIHARVAEPPARLPALVKLDACMHPRRVFVVVLGGGATLFLLTGTVGTILAGECRRFWVAVVMVTMVLVLHLPRPMASGSSCRDAVLMAAA